MRNCCSQCAKGRPCCGARKNPSKPAATKASMKAVPKASIDWILGKVHVMTPDADVAADIERRCAKAGASPALVKKCVAYALKVHKRNRDLYIQVMTGNIGSGESRRSRRGSK